MSDFTRSANIAVMEEMVKIAWFENVFLCALFLKDTRTKYAVGFITA
jgi:hypothetical protein